eukprot:2851867-Prymnesium_polylepis.1
MIDEILGEVVDDVLLSMALKEANDRIEAAKPSPDSESDAVAVAPVFTNELPEALVAAGALVALLGDDTHL